MFSKDNKLNAALEKVVAIVSNNQAITPTPPHPRQLYRIKDVIELTTVSRSSIWAWVKTKKFPAPYSLSENCTVWKSDEVHDWIDARIAASKQAGV